MGVPRTGRTAVSAVRRTAAMAKPTGGPDMALGRMAKMAMPRETDAYDGLSATAYSASAASSRQL